MSDERPLRERLDEIVELLGAALREDAIVGVGGRAVMRWTGVDRVLLAHHKLADLRWDVDPEERPS